MVIGVGVKTLEHTNEGSVSGCSHHTWHHHSMLFRSFQQRPRGLSCLCHAAP